MKSGKETKNYIVLTLRGDAQKINSSHPINSLLPPNPWRVTLTLIFGVSYYPS